MSTDRRHVATATTANRWERWPDHLAYRNSRENITELTGGRPEAANLPIPACPGWTVLDAVGHLVAICRAVAADEPGNLWEVPHTRGATLDELLTEWAALDAPMAQVVTTAPQLRHTMMMMDAFTHELDIRRTLGAPVPADHPSYPSSLDLVVRGLANSVREHGLPALRIETPGGGWQAGDGEPAATVHGHRHDLLRSLTGRRTHRQISGLTWSAAPEPWLPAFTWGPFDPPAEASEALTDER
ncbi:maleylpyruvate isomerase family mycothiol-dependent enzyme [Streptomyces sp. FH025]|uniref:maleylpyruvate isomerase family mycothiol-dependent enzyme n=1 Tax=Streptomyces sp. FH025 TaxID=2815937 RepID=UPI001A9DF630|nr:maleylpyruvate isomerase family mycothiol-dependent enzyme [Streptomyces sp. FH025]MBO1413351.1 maleylpyruvate isomerase family mycothiol-dependent enzyme [Streptomyces sp. FH025]